jgi:hypothetical protein
MWLLFALHMTFRNGSAESFRLLLTERNARLRVSVRKSILLWLSVLYATIYFI